MSLSHIKLERNNKTKKPDPKYPHGSLRNRCNTLIPRNNRVRFGQALGEERAERREQPPASLTGIPLAHEAEELLGPGSPGHPLQEVLQRQRQLLLRGDSGRRSARTPLQPGGAAPGTEPPAPNPSLPHPRGSPSPGRCRTSRTSS